MTLKKQNQFLGSPMEGAKIEENVNAWIAKINSDTTFPENFVSDLKEFGRRNSMTLGYSVHDKVEVTCERCAKAYAVNLVKKNGMEIGVLEKIEEIFNCETGHNGYYLDKGKVRKIDLA